MVVRQLTCELEMNFCSSSVKKVMLGEGKRGCGDLTTNKHFSIPVVKLKVHVTC